MGQPQQTSLMKQFSLQLTKINVRFMYQKAQ